MGKRIFTPPERRESPGMRRSKVIGMAGLALSAGWLVAFSNEAVRVGSSWALFTATAVWAAWATVLAGRALRDCRARALRQSQAEHGAFLSRQAAAEKSARPPSAGSSTDR